MRIDLIAARKCHAGIYDSIISWYVTSFCKDKTSRSRSVIEDNVKILTSQVHPIDNNSVPYNFSSKISPLLHNAARALNLPARSSESYHSVFGLSPPQSSISYSSSGRSSKSNGSSYSNGDNLAPIDSKYTGHILVSGYNIAYVLPKEFPPRYKANGSLTDNESESYSRSSQGRASAVEKNVVHFMAAIDMWVPYVSRPPKSPYVVRLLSSYFSFGSG